ncbi:hypothetical protein TNCV_2657801 [Trichonephila clavipes]|nr:hypothetical protein TNCV_2657801 [Trichonephila clavipes]
MEIPLRTAYGQNGRSCGMQPKAKHSLRAQAHQSKSRTETEKSREKGERERSTGKEGGRTPCHLRCPTGRNQRCKPGLLDGYWYRLTTLSVGCSSSSQSIGEGGRHPFWHARIAARPSQWKYTPKKSCPVVSRKWATASVLSMCLGMGSTEARVSHGFPRLLIFWVTEVHLSMYVEMMLFDLLIVKGDSLVEMTRLFGWLSHCRGSQHDLGPMTSVMVHHPIGECCQCRSATVTST